MKTAFLTTVLALAASSSHASLTASNTTYDLFSFYVRLSLGVTADAVVNEENLWLSEQFETVVVKTEEALEAEKESYAYYADLFADFYDQAKAYDADAYESIIQRAKEAFANPSAPMTHSPKEWIDVKFDVLEQIPPPANIKNLAALVHGQREAMEKLVDDGASTARLVVAMDVFEEKMENMNGLPALYGKKLKEVYAQTGDEYGIEWMAADEKEETKKPRAKKAKKAKHTKAKHTKAKHTKAKHTKA